MYRYEQFDSKYDTTIYTNGGYVFYEAGVRIDYGLNMGASYIYKERWSTNVNCNISLRKEPPVSELSSTTRSLSFGIGYRF